jgi:hypothetical protein
MLTLSICISRIFGTVRAAEFVTLAYLGYLMLLTVNRRLAPQRRAQIQTLSAIAILVVLLLAWDSHIPGVAIMRDWIPALYILGGYWLSGRFYTGPMLTWETRLAEIDRLGYHVDGTAADAAGGAGVGIFVRVCACAGGVRAAVLLSDRLRH